MRFYAGAEYRLTDPNGNVIDNVSLLYRAHGVTGAVPQPEEVPGRAWFALDRLPTPEEQRGPLNRAMLAFARSL